MIRAFINATVYTADFKKQWADFIITDNNKIEFVGSLANSEEEYKLNEYLKKAVSCSHRPEAEEPRIHRRRCAPPGHRAGKRPSANRLQS